MVDLHECCMCGDVGFPEKLFRCSNCRYRFQHEYCSNYYSEHSEPIEVCEWCKCEAKNSTTSSSSSIRMSNNKSVHNALNDQVRSPYSSGDKIKHHRREEGGKATGKTHSPRPAARRYKLLKDVMC